MELVATLPVFVLAVILISASPGPAMVLVVRRAAEGGFTRAVPTVLGLQTGLYIWALLAAGGLAALVAASEAAFVVLRVLGAAFLLYLGVKAWRSVWKSRGAVPREDIPAGAGQSQCLAWWKAFGEGLVVMLANPKAAAFMVAFYPQFVPADQPLFATTAALALLQVAIEIGIYLGLASVVGRARGWFTSPAVRRRLEAVTGTVFVALGLRVAMASR
ncbi:LysE family translocator [Phytoactinopolyspora mesophila]|uniref:LysE family translocator n=1 Tax=Phytoactinopolyspora mesophila TaxID=2650750 RepID=A0A7K3M6D1_9ACTN|nr:LysE family translocator [Phytoactinopolyspora mesophila]NDL58826.1 LysE family translocator [Phytoactinopolyspora mesophila]